MGIFDYFKSSSSQENKSEEFKENIDIDALSEAESLKQDYLKNPTRVTLNPEEINHQEQFNTKYNKNLKEGDESINEEIKPTTTSKNKYLEQVRDKKLQYDFSQREERILDMAKENCSDFEVKLYNCFRNGSLLDRLQFCNLEQAKLSSCIKNQKTILENLGYGKFTNGEKKDMALAEAAYDVLLEVQKLEEAKNN